jgi:hypothetical protein
MLLHHFLMVGVTLGGVSGLDSLAHEDVHPHPLLLLSRQHQQVAVLVQELDVPSVLGFVPVVLVLLYDSFFWANGLLQGGL